MAALIIDAKGIGEVQRRLDTLVRVGTDLSPAMRDIGEFLMQSTKDRFVEEEDPEGSAWHPLSDATKAKKRRNVDKILTRDAYLRNVVYQAEGDSVRIGSPMIYAGTHQFGAEKGSFGSTGRGSPIPWGDIPARPFLGLSDDDRDGVADIIRRFIIDEIEI